MKSEATVLMRWVPNLSSAFTFLVGANLPPVNVTRRKKINTYGIFELMFIRVKSGRCRGELMRMMKKIPSKSQFSIATGFSSPENLSIQQGKGQKTNFVQIK